MTLQEQVCTLEQSKRLKELGCGCDCLFAWWENPMTDEWSIIPMSAHAALFNCAGAYTVAELGEMLIKRANYNGYDVLHEINSKLLGVRDCDFWFSVNAEVYAFPTEAQARAALLIHILEKEKEHDT